MNEKLFVGLTFRSDDNLARKIEGFRKRFDHNYTKASFSHMSLLAPFELHAKDLESCKEELKEELDSFFFGQETPLKLSFTGVNFLQTKKNNILYLNPEFSPDLEHCMDLVRDICTSFIPRNIKYKANPKQFLPLGSFKQTDPLVEIMDAIKLEFENNSDLTITGISLFRKKYGIWTTEENLISFENTKDAFLQYQSTAI